MAITALVTRKRIGTNMTKRPSKTASTGQSSRESSDQDIDAAKSKKAEAKAAKDKASKEAATAEEAEADADEAAESKPSEAQKAEAQAAETVKTEAVDKKIEALEDEEEGED